MKRTNSKKLRDVKLNQECVPPRSSEQEMIVNTHDCEIEGREYKECVDEVLGKGEGSKLPSWQKGSGV